MCNLYRQYPFIEIIDIIIRMQIPKTEEIHKATMLGIGGEDVYYITRFLKCLNKDIIGFDIKKNDRTKYLEGIGIEIYYKNPEGKLSDTEIVIYSDSLPDYVIKKIEEQNKTVPFIEVGRYKREIFSLLQSSQLSKEEDIAVKKSGLFPLINRDFGGMKLVGVTGTDGKTSVVSMISHMLTKLGYKPGVISTVGMSIGESKKDIGFHVTTPSSHSILKSLNLMKKRGCTHAVIECTSQGLYMGRVAGLKFDTVVYTNITREHLGYHKTWIKYAEAKSLLIRENLKEGGYAILNRDDKKGFKYINKYAKKKLIYSTTNLNRNADTLSAENIKESLTGLSFNIKNSKVFIPVLGKYNVSNALAAILALKSFGIEEGMSASLLGDFSPVEGRMNIIQERPFRVIVDFAHTPNGLLNALKTVKKITNKSKRIILVFGCAAKRDEYKRPVMGKYAKEYADITILTAEDCRTESLKEINNQIGKGWRSVNTKEERMLFRFDNDNENVKVRRRAIKKAISLAKDGDTILITGKGHEKSLCFGLKEYNWNEIEEVQRLLGHIKIGRTYTSGT